MKHCATVTPNSNHVSSKFPYHLAPMSLAELRFAEKGSHERGKSSINMRSLLQAWPKICWHPVPAEESWAILGRESRAELAPACRGPPTFGDLGDSVATVGALADCWRGAGKYHPNSTHPFTAATFCLTQSVVHTLLIQSGRVSLES